MSWETHHDIIIMKANKQLGLTKRTCHFVKNITQKRTLYITLVRSLLQHCGEIWGPNAITAANKFEPIQKKAVKWILGEVNRKYSKNEYYTRLYKLNLLPIYEFFSVKKLKLFHSIIHETSYLKMPSYIVQSRVSRSSSNRHKYSLSHDVKLPTVRPFGSSFFPSTIELWNPLPESVKNCPVTDQFLIELKAYYWQQIMSHFELEPD